MNKENSFEKCCTINSTAFLILLKNKIKFVKSVKLRSVRKPKLNRNIHIILWRKMEISIE